MEEWDAFVRRTRRRLAYRKRFKRGELEAGDEFYYPPRINPWPILGGAAAVVALVAAYITWTDDGSPPTEPTETTVTIPGGAGLTSRDLSGCLSFHTTISSTRNILRSAESPEGIALAESGAMTADLLTGYHTTAELMADRFDDEELTGLVVALEETLGSVRIDAVAKEAAGTPVWAEIYPTVLTTIKEFGDAFDDRCALGGVLVEVAG